MSVNKYHKKSSSLVKASAQAGVYDNIKEKLTDEEAAVYKRGRNAKSATAQKMLRSWNTGWPQGSKP